MPGNDVTLITMEHLFSTSIPAPLSSLYILDVSQYKESLMALGSRLVCFQTIAGVFKRNDLKVKRIRRVYTSCEWEVASLSMRESYLWNYFQNVLIVVTIEEVEFLPTSSSVAANRDIVS